MKAEEIFLAAVEKNACGERAAYVERACGNDAALRAQVAALLQSHGQAGSFLEQPLFASPPTSDTPALAEGPGTRIGPYKLLQEIGTGGMGTVYMAEQQEPVRRMVALKIIKPGMDSAQVIARFEAERQALALMDHPNIAKVLDAGTTESGRPYFVMELVKGIPITRFCDENQMTPRQRLELFLSVCQAVQHAHQKGIIHRDLKPSNVLVALYDDQPVPKVIDFGVAKATSQKLTERTLFTAFGSFVGTLEYMSPEQAKLNALDIDTRSDVYALGVLLYELLTGNTPLEHERLKQTALDELLRTIREEEPPRPSTRLSRSGEALVTISARRGTEPAKLGQVLRGELDWIIMKALEKDRTRRYETANGLARDLQRYLADEPVEACPPTLGYRLWKVYRKNRAAVITTAAVVAGSLLAATGQTWNLLQARAAKAAAVAARNAEAQQRDEASRQRDAAVVSEQVAQQERDEAQRQRDEVRGLNEKLQATQAQLRGTLYAAHMNLAHNAWEAGGAERVRELLEHHRPKAGEADQRGFEWYYLHRLCHSELLTLKGHAGGVNSVAFSPDGKRLASGDSGWGLQDPSVVGGVKVKPVAGEVKVWDAQTGQELLSLKGHRGEVESVAFSPDGKRLASSSGRQLLQGGKMVPGEIKLWDARTGQELLTLKALKGNGNSFRRKSVVVFSPDGKQLASAGPGEVKIWNAQTGQELRTLKDSLSSSVAFSPDGKRLASTSADNTVKVWDTQTGQELLTIKGGGFSSVVFSLDGKRLASATMDHTVKVWDAHTGQELLTLKGHSSIVNSVVFSPDSKLLATASGDNTLKVWDAQTGQEVRTFAGHTNEVCCVVFSPDGMRLASASGDQTAKVWDVTRSQEVRTLSGHTEFIYSVAFSPDGKRLASASGDKTVKVWDARTGQEVLTLQGHTGPVSSLAFSPDGKHLASGSANFGWQAWLLTSEVKVWDAQTGQELLTLPGHSSQVWSVAFSPDGKRLASTGGTGGLVVDAQTGQALLRLQGDTRDMRSLVFSPDGKRLASADTGGMVKVWDAQTGQWLLTCKGHTGVVWRVVFSPDGKRLASASDDKTVKVWDAQTGQEFLTCKGHTGAVRSVAFNPDGKRLASASMDRTVKVWDAQTGQEMLTLKTHAVVLSVVFNPDGHRLASGAAGSMVKIWDATPLPEKP